MILYEKGLNSKSPFKIDRLRKFETEWLLIKNDNNNGLSQTERQKILNIVVIKRLMKLKSERNGDI